MKALTNVEILITKQGVQYNYEGVLYTEEQFREKFLGKKFIAVYKEFGDSADYDREIFIGEYYDKQDAIDDINIDVATYIQGNKDYNAHITENKGTYISVDCNNGDYGCEWWIIEK